MNRQDRREMFKATGMDYNDCMSDAVNQAIDGMGFRDLRDHVSDWRELGSPGEFRDWLRSRIWDRIERRDRAHNYDFLEMVP